MSDEQVRRLLVIYPSGRAVKVTGRWVGLGSPDRNKPIDAVVIALTQPARVRDRDLEADSDLAIDGRCVVVDMADLSVLYHPRMPTVELTRDLHKAMEPDWPEKAFRAVDEMRRRRRAV